MHANVRFPAMAAGTAGAAALLALAGQRGRRRRVERGRGDECFLTTGAGTKLSYRFRAFEDGLPAGRGRPVLVCETGLLATMEHWAWMAAALPPTLPLLIYDRAGYGRSGHPGHRPCGEAGPVADLVDLVRAVCGDRRVVLIGHAMGAGLATRAASELNDRTAGLVLLEPLGPEAGTTFAPAVPALFAGSLRWGYGSLLNTPDWLAGMPSAARRLLEDQYRDAAFWEAGAREADIAPKMGGVSRQQLLDAPAPVCVVLGPEAAAASAERLPGVAHHYVAGASPGHMLLSRPSAEAAAGIIAEFAGKPTPGNRWTKVGTEMEEENGGRRWPA